MPLRHPTPAPLALLSVLALTACGPVQPQVVLLQVPDSLKTCAPEPVPPRVLSNDADLVDFMLSLADAGADCRGRLDAVVRAIGR